MKNPVKQYDSFAIKYGSLSIYERGKEPYKYREGVYYHPLGVVTVISESDYTRVDTSLNGRRYVCTVQTELTDGQIKHFCRKFLLEILNPNNVRL